MSGPPKSSPNLGCASWFARATRFTPGPSRSDTYGTPARCHSQPACSRGSRVLAVEVDPDRQQIRLQETYGRRTQSRDRVTRIDEPQSFSGIILGDEPGGPVVPSPAYANANARVRLDVPDVARTAPVLGDDPENPVVETVGNRVAPRLPRLATDGLQDRDPRGRKPQ